MLQARVSWLSTQRTISTCVLKGRRWGGLQAMASIAGIPTGANLPCTRKAALSELRDISIPRDCWHEKQAAHHHEPALDWGSPQYVRPLRAPGWTLPAHLVCLGMRNPPSRRCSSRGSPGTRGRLSCIRCRRFGRHSHCSLGERERGVRARGHSAAPMEAPSPQPGPWKQEAGMRRPGTH